MKIIYSDCLVALKEMDENSIDSIVTDPPYGLYFMGKKWDYDVPSKEIWGACFRALKPGGYLLSFAGTRTQHRMAVNIEDAGFEIRDMIAWVYGSGFPKSLNIGKSVDKLQGNEREDLGVKTSSSYPDSDGVAMYKNRSQSEGSQVNTGGMPHITKGTSEWEGWGTALKPALEPITVARKPISEKTVAENCLKWGTGGINIDGSRVGTTGARNNGNSKGTEGSNSIGVYGKAVKQDYNMGRFPANLIHDGSDEVVSLFPNPHGAGSASRFFYCAKASKADRNEGCEGLEDKEWKTEGACIPERKNRPFNASKNNHPTVKPTDLMRYLCRLVTPPNGTILDPFMGSGSTGKAAVLEGFNFIGIEREVEYVKIAESRIGHAEEQKAETLL